MDIDIGYIFNINIRFTFGCTADHQRRDWDDRVQPCAIGTLWKSNMAMENPQLFMWVLYGFIWFYMVLYGFIWFYMVLYGFMWFYVVLCGFIWFYMVLYHSKFNTDRENKPLFNGNSSSNPYLPVSMLIYWRVYHSKNIYKWVIFHCHVWLPEG